MITSDRQLKVTKEKIEFLKNNKSARTSQKINPVLQKAGELQSLSLIDELELQVIEYENLKSKGLPAIKLSSPEDMMLLPIRYRIAKQLTQEDFANFVDVPLRQITRYEAEEYGNINGETLKKILHKIPLKITGKVSEGA